MGTVKPPLRAWLLASGCLGLSSLSWAAPSEGAAVLYTTQSTYLLPVDGSPSRKAAGTWMQGATGEVRGARPAGRRSKHTFFSSDETREASLTLTSVLGGYAFYVGVLKDTSTQVTQGTFAFPVPLVAEPGAFDMGTPTSQKCEPHGANTDTGPLPADHRFHGGCNLKRLAELSVAKLSSEAQWAKHQETLESCVCEEDQSVYESGYGRIIRTSDARASTPTGARTVTVTRLNENTCPSAEDMCGSEAAFRRLSPKLRPIWVSNDGRYALAWNRTEQLGLYRQGESKPIQTVQLDGSPVGARFHPDASALADALTRTKANSESTWPLFESFFLLTLWGVESSPVLPTSLNGPVEAPANRWPVVRTQLLESIQQHLAHPEPMP